ncbi:cupredoxin family protein [Permianibacter sp. IMCC34836]|nr:cupredoxin family protein [Permianibacter fluminis]
MRYTLAAATLAVLTSYSAVTLAGGTHPGEHHHDHDESAIGQAGDAGKVSRTVMVDMTDAMRFVPAQVSVKQNETIRFVVKNSGKVKHEFVLGTEAALKEHYQVMLKFPEMEHADANMVTVAPGQTGEVIWQFTKSGKVDFACLQPGHYDAGMKGLVAVVGANMPTEEKDGHTDHKH